MIRYWSLPVIESIPQALEAELIDELDRLLLDAVRVRLRSDVPVGAFLSGGLDSSLIVALGAQVSPKPLNTFTIKFSDKSSDESRYASQIADYFGTRHVVHEVNEEMLSVIPDLTAEMDQPFADSSLVPMYFVCREARKDVTEVAGTLSANGGGTTRPAGNCNELDFCVASAEVSETLVAQCNQCTGFESPEVVATYRWQNNDAGIVPDDVSATIKAKGTTKDERSVGSVVCSKGIGVDCYNGAITGSYYESKQDPLARIKSLALRK
jgi:hypothetical protein